MPRTQARLCTLDKVDDDWLALTVDEQWLYAVLLRQHRLTLIGVLDLIPHRWASASDVSTDRVLAALAGLGSAGFVIVDETAGEVLVRTFVRHDIDTSRLSAPTKAGLWNAWKAITSPTLRACAVTEIPEDVWSKLEATAPPEAAEIRRSPPFEREQADPFEREQADPFERPSSFLPPPTGVPTFILSPTGGTGSGPESGDGIVESTNVDTPTTVGVNPSDVGDTAATETMVSDPTAERGVANDDTSVPPALEGDALEQAVRRTAVLIGRRQTIETAGVDDPEAYAASCTRKLLDKADPEPRQTITAALHDSQTPEDIAAGWGKGTDVFGFPAGQQPKADDPAVIQEAADRAKRREQETRDRIEAMGAIKPAPIPEHLRRGHRHGTEPSEVRS